jgi:hypothetical protein
LVAAGLVEQARSRQAQAQLLVVEAVVEADVLRSFSKRLP